jgi:hypothetical protein
MHCMPCTCPQNWGANELNPTSCMVSRSPARPQQSTITTVAVAAHVLELHQAQPHRKLFVEKPPSCSKQSCAYVGFSCQCQSQLIIIMLPQTAAAAATATAARVHEAVAHTPAPCQLLLLPLLDLAGLGASAAAAPLASKLSGRGCCCGAHCDFGGMAGMLPVSVSHSCTMLLAVGGTRA